MVTLSSDGRITIPKRLRRMAGLVEGDKFDAEALSDGQILLSPKKQHDTNHSPPKSWHTNGFGKDGFRGSGEPLGWPAILILSTAAYLAWTHSDSIQISETLPQALNFLYVVAGISILPLIRAQLQQERPAGSVVDEAATWLAKLAIPSIVLVWVYELFDHSPALDGSLKQKLNLAHDIMGVASIVSLLLILFVIFKCASIRRYLDKDYAYRNPYATVPPSSRRFTWAIDASVWMLVAAVSFFLVKTVGIAVDSIGNLSAVWLWTIAFGICYLFHISCLVRCGYTVGHKFQRVRVVSVPSQTKPAWWISFLRTMIPVLPIYCFGYFRTRFPDRILGQGGGLIDHLYNASAGAAIVLVVVGLFSIGMVREVHLRGQGILDLMFRTVSVKV